MEWLLDNLGKMLPVILAVLYFWVTSKKRRSGTEESEEGDGSDEAERARRIQEEIRRRILERQRGESPGPHVGPPVLVEESLHQPQEEESLHQPQEEESLHQPQDRLVRSTGGTFAESAVPDPDENYQEVLERQAHLTQRFEEARRLAERQKESRMGIRGQTASTKQKRTEAASVKWAVNPLRSELLTNLKGRTGLKRAILLREVLGEPVGVRQGPLPQK
jgi:hypothetical protein